MNKFLKYFIEFFIAIVIVFVVDLLINYFSQNELSILIVFNLTLYFYIPIFLLFIFSILMIYLLYKDKGSFYLKHKKAFTISSSIIAVLIYVLLVVIYEMCIKDEESFSYWFGIIILGSSITSFPFIIKQFEKEHNKDIERRNTEK